jgi:hypothetical protein
VPTSQSRHRLDGSLIERRAPWANGDAEQRTLPRSVPEPSRDLCLLCDAARRAFDGGVAGMEDAMRRNARICAWIRSFRLSGTGGEGLCMT